GYIDQEFEFLDRKEQILRLAGSLALNEPNINPATLKQMALDIKTSSRMSTTFRFAAGSARLDSKSVLDVGRLARFVEFLVETGRQKRFGRVGSPDAVGISDRTAPLWVARARGGGEAVVRGARAAVPPQMIAPRGFGPLLPTS